MCVGVCVCVCVCVCACVCVYICTGDPHASERIGPSCSRAQLGISVTHLVAAARGANGKDIDLIQVMAGRGVKNTVI